MSTAARCWCAAAVSASSVPGLYCSKIAVPDGWLLPYPDGLDLAQVAAMPVAGITAWMALHGRAQIGALDRVLILGASGGVGAVAIQLAKAVGATGVGPDRARRTRSTASRPTAPTT